MDKKVVAVKLTKAFKAEIKDQVHYWFCVVLSDALIQQIAEACPSHIRQALRHSIFDTYEREYFGDAMVKTIMTEKDHWPCNGESGTKYSKTFLARLIKACKKHKLEISTHPERKKR